MPKFETYGDDTPVAADKFLFYKGSSAVLKTSTLTNLATAVKNLISSFFTSSTVVPSTAPSAGQVLVGNSGSTAFAATTISGDATLSSAGTLTIGSNTVSYAKMQDVSAASRLLGRGSASGAGDVEQITLGTGLSMSGTTLNVSAGTGNVVQSVDATAANHVFVAGGADKSRVETPMTVDPSTGDVDGIGDLDVDSVTTPEITISATHATDDTYHGITIDDVDAGATIAQWDLVYVDSSGDWGIADANSASAFPARGIAVEGGTAAAVMKVLVIGTARNDAWNWTPGGDLFMSATAGEMTQTAPATSGDEVQKVGFALTADKIFVNFGACNYATVT